MLILNAKIRKNVGKSSSRRLRSLNKIPAILYGKYGEEPVAIELLNNEISNIQKKEEFLKEMMISISKVDKILVRIKQVQWHPFKSKIIHIDFIRI